MIFHNSSSTKETSSSEKNPNYLRIGVEKIIFGYVKVFKEVFLGVKNNTINWGYCSFFLIIANVMMLASLDVLLFDYFGYSQIYLEFHFLSWIAYIILSTFGFATWGAYVGNAKRKLLQRLQLAFTNASLKSKSGKFPNFVSDVPIDENNRKLTLTNSGITKEQFESAKGSIATSLHVFIDEIKENREEGKIELLYSLSPLPSLIKYDEVSKFSNFTYTVGQTRSKEIRESFEDSPHLLVAGQTQGGKSNFLRQAFVTLYMKNKNCEFTLIDLKDGLELGVFKNLKNVDFYDEFKGVIRKLKNLDKELGSRMKIIKESDINNISGYNQQKVQQGKPESQLKRHIVIIDEAVELFLKTDKNDIASVQQARLVLSRIARLGRACGVHLVIATQRPDVKSIDPQIKANLTSTLCFPVPNLATSMTVLSNGRAASLPSESKGRAIWKTGGVMTEVQTPFLPEDEIKSIVASLLQKPKPATKKPKDEAEIIPGVKKSENTTSTDPAPTKRL